MEDIKKWLISDMDFAAGAALFAKYCKNKTFVHSITINPRNAKKLEYELKNLPEYRLLYSSTKNAATKNC